MRITDGMRKPRRRDPRKLNLTIRLVARAGATREQLIDALEASIRQSQVQPPIKEIHFVDWRKGVAGGPIAQGRYVPPALWSALKDFYAAITHPKTKLRVGRVED